MTELNRRRDVSVRLNSYRCGISSPLTTHLADKVFAIQFQSTHDTVPRFAVIKPRLEVNSSRGCRQCFCCQGSTTVSITWMTPLLAMISVAVTRALSTITLPSFVLMRRARPLTVFAELKFTTSPAVTRPGTT